MQAARVEIAITADDKASPTLRRVNQTVAEGSRNSRTALDGMAQSSRRTQSALVGLGGSARASILGISSAADVAKGALAGLGLAAGMQLAKGLLDAGLAAERLRRTFEYATGGALAGREAFAFVSAEADRLGINLRSSADSYARLTAAAKGTSLEGEGTRELFTGLAQASATLGLSAEQTGGAINAFQQMISKGTVQAEELRGQLAERLPGAFQMAARAMGMTTQELGKAMERGEVFADDLVPKMAKALISDFPPAADSATQALERFKNEAQSGAKAAGEVMLVSLGWLAKGYLGVANAVRQANEEMGKQQAAKFGSLDPDAQARQSAQRAALVEGLRLAKEAKEEEKKKTASPTNAQQSAIDEMNKEDEKKRKADAKAAVRAAEKRKKDTLDARHALEDSEVALIQSKTEQQLRALDLRYERERLALGTNQEAKTLLGEAYHNQEKAILAARAQEVGELRLAAAVELNLALDAERQKHIDAEREVASRQIQLDQQVLDSKFGLAQAVVGAFGKLSGAGKAAFLASKAVAAAQIWVSTLAAEAQALATFPGPPYTIPLAAKIKQNGMLNLAALAATTVAGFEDGGIVPGTSTRGDRVPAMVNSKEMILNQRQQANLFAMANGRGQGGGGGGNSYSFGNTIIQMPPGASPEDARRLGNAAAEAQADRLKRLVDDLEEAQSRRMFRRGALA